MFNILIADKVDKNVIDQIKNPKFTFNYQPEITPQDLIMTIPNYEGLIVRSRTKVTQEVIDRGHNLKVIVGSAAALIILMFSRQKRKIAVINSPNLILKLSQSLR